MNNFPLWPYAMLTPLVLVLIACAPSPEQTKPKDAQEIVDSIVYVRSTAGPCYGVATTSRINSSMTYSLSVSVVPASCDLVKDKGQ